MNPCVFYFCNIFWFSVYVRLQEWAIIQEQGVLPLWQGISGWVLIIFLIDIINMFMWDSSGVFFSLSNREALLFWWYALEENTTLPPQSFITAFKCQVTLKRVSQCISSDSERLLTNATEFIMSQGSFTWRVAKAGLLTLEYFMSWTLLFLEVHCCDLLGDMLDSDSWASPLGRDYGDIKQTLIAQYCTQRTAYVSVLCCQKLD